MVKPEHQSGQNGFIPDMIKIFKYLIPFPSRTPAIVVKDDMGVVPVVLKKPDNHKRALISNGRQTGGRIPGK